MLFYQSIACYQVGSDKKEKKRTGSLEYQGGVVLLVDLAVFNNETNGLSRLLESL